MNAYDRVVLALEALGGKPIETRPPHSARRMRALLERHDNPDAAFSSVVIAGTVGKGSTAASLAALLQAHGHRVGLFTGPHLERYTERIRVNGRDITERPFVRVLTQALATAASFVERNDPAWRPSVLEVLVLAACLHFRDAGVRWAVMEAGVGGARDYTMALDAKGAILTQVALDHMHLLGKTVKEITQEKMAIARAGIPLICSARNLQARLAVKSCSSSVRLIDREFWVSAVDTTATHVTFDFKSTHTAWNALKLPLAGVCQADNAAAAIACLEDLASRGLTPIIEEKVRHGLSTVRMPGRFERFVGPPEVILDGAHQPEGAAALRKTLGQIYSDRPITLVLGVLADKDRAGVIQALAPAASSLILTQPPWAGRSGNIQEVVPIAQATGVPVEMQVDPAAAFERAREIARKSNGVVCVTGSLYLVGAIRALLN